MIGERGEDERERAGPEPRGQALGRLGPVARRMSRACAMPATWTISGLIAGRPLAAKIRATAAGLVAIGSQAVDRLGREGDQPAALQDLRRQIERGGIGLVRVDDDDARGAVRDTFDHARSR